MPGRLSGLPTAASAVEIRGLCSAPALIGNATPSVAHYRLPDAAGLGFTGVFR